MGNLININIKIDFTTIMNIQEISDQVFGDDPAKRAKWFKLFEDPVWKPVYN